MALTIKWTTEARQTFENIVLYLQENWSDKEVENFINRADELISLLAKQPYLFQASAYKDVRKAIVTKHNSLFYLVYQSEIYLLSFWDNRKDPNKNQYS